MQTYRNMNDAKRTKLGLYGHPEYFTTDNIQSMKELYYRCVCLGIVWDDKNNPLLSGDKT